ncbi:hypothetical protein H5410_006826 [Solanum commersonii]|uniref:Uncharacterized protein n=1 Tax=Solanum commersonii TaxID=4109 RepID=A0A9J6AAU7_SOLCO|nr:hypothetical protein H5410_006826 [Solanum commersonii]
MSKEGEVRKLDRVCFSLKGLLGLLVDEYCFETMGSTFNTQILVDKLEMLNNSQQSIEIFQETNWWGMETNSMFEN